MSLSRRLPGAPSPPCETPTWSPLTATLVSSKSTFRRNKWHNVLQSTSCPPPGFRKAYSPNTRRSSPPRQKAPSRGLNAVFGSLLQRANDAAAHGTSGLLGLHERASDVVLTD